MVPSADDFRNALNFVFKYKITIEKSDYVEIRSADLHRLVGGYPAEDGNHRMKTCCEVMYSLKNEDDIIVVAPPKGNGASLTIKYKLPRK